MNPGLEDIAATLRSARKAKALTQAALGERVGLPQSHVSKIEKGVVDLKLSSLVEIARALDLELTLVPRKALPAVEGAVRAQGSSADTSRALALLSEQAQLAERLKGRLPDIAQVERYQHIIQTIPKLPFDAARLKALDEALQPARRLKAIVDAHGGAVRLARQLEEATGSLQRFRNLQIHSPPPETARPLPAYRLEEDDE